MRTEDSLPTCRVYYIDTNGAAGDCCKTIADPVMWLGQDAAECTQR